MKGTIFLVDDEAYVRESISAVLERHGFTVRAAASAGEALAPDALHGVDAVITDLRMPGLDGLALLRRLHERDPAMPIIILTGHGSVVSAVECLKAGAYDFVQKPAEPGALALLAERAVRDAARRRELTDLRRARDRVPPGAREADDPVGVSAAWTRVVELATTVARTDTSVLILGESGTGKEELARLIHRRSARATQPFVPVNCGSIPQELFESEFFGHRKGAFTGAIDDRDGRFRVADGGTLFLDEIGCMPDGSQAKVLRVLENGIFERIGETRSTCVDVRVIAATNMNLSEAAENGRFRRDLYYRVAVVTIEVPPLRERPEDVEVLAQCFLDRYARRFARPMAGIDPDALALLRAYRWPGNVRELRNVMERGVILERSAHLTPASLPPDLVEGADDASGAAETGLNLRANLRARERQIPEEALARAGGVRREAARLLGIDERNLSYFLKKHGLGTGRGRP